MCVCPHPTSHAPFCHDPIGCSIHNVLKTTDGDVVTTFLIVTTSTLYKRHLLLSVFSRGARCEITVSQIRLLRRNGKMLRERQKNALLSRATKRKRGSDKKAERDANCRREESEAESAKRKAANAQRDAKRRKAETKEASEQRRAKNATRMRKRRAIYPSKYAALTPLNENDIEEHYLGKMDQVCRFCTAKYFAAEKSRSSTFGSCCHGGTIPTPPVRQHCEHIEQFPVNGQNVCLNLGKNNDCAYFANSILFQ